MHRDESHPGLYAPGFEHDACGVGAICNLKGEKSHSIVRDALEILERLSHRGACGCDPETGDGAGILMQVPHDFLVERARAEAGIGLPDVEEYGVGMVFLPMDPDQRRVCEERFEEVVRAEGQEVLGWRDVPVVAQAIGVEARSTMPFIRQLFVGRGAGMTDPDAFERKLFVIRRVVENAIRGSDLPEKGSFYVPSLSYRTLTYKGLLMAEQVAPFFPDLADERMTSGLALVHSRYSTNTFPIWELAQPFRFLCHNGEINTVRGNQNWMAARQGLFESDYFGDDMPKLFPVLTAGASDSAILDNAIELLYHTGRSLAHCMMMLIPEAWQNHRTMSDAKKAFYEYHSCMMEPWDGPASIPFSDGKRMGAVLDRNGLRPSRYLVTKDGFVIMGSETGVLDVDPANVESKGRLQPGRMFLVDTDQGRIVDDEEIKEEMAARRPYRAWLVENLRSIDDLPGASASAAPAIEGDELTRLQQAFGFSLEDLKIYLGPMATDGKDPIGSMGTDTPVAVLSDKPQLLYNYFKQLFAQVTNPPAGRNPRKTGDLPGDRPSGAESKTSFSETPEHCRQLKIRLEHPDADGRGISARFQGPGRRREPARRQPFPWSTPWPMAAARELDQGPRRRHLPHGRREAVREEGRPVLILTDRSVNRGYGPRFRRSWRRPPSTITLSAKCCGPRCGTHRRVPAKPREIHHFCLPVRDTGPCAMTSLPRPVRHPGRSQMAGGVIPDLGLEAAIDRLPHEGLRPRRW